MTFFAGLKILILLFVIVLGFMVATHRTAAEPSLDNFHNAFSGPPSDPYGYAVALLSIRFAFAGFENANCEHSSSTIIDIDGPVLTCSKIDVLTEVDHPEEKLPSSSMTAVGIVSILYLLTNIAYVSCPSKCMKFISYTTSSSSCPRRRCNKLGQRLQFNSLL
jgi:amino acid transporter